MSVYKEGFYFIKEVIEGVKLIFNDSVDLGMPVKKNDSTWKMMNQIWEDYGIKGTRFYDKHQQRAGFTFELMEEWSDEPTKRKYELTYQSLKPWANHPSNNFKGFDGYAEVTPVGNETYMLTYKNLINNG